MMSEPTRAEQIAQTKSKLWEALGKLASCLLVGPGLIYVAWSRPHYMERLLNKLTVYFYIIGATFCLYFFVAAWELLKLNADLIRLKFVEKDPPAAAPDADIDVSFDDPPG
jgi:hypothetical protein